MMDFYWLVLGSLCVWRITHLLQAEDGPWDIVVRVRRWLGDGFWGKLLDCFYCLSVWIALPIALLVGHDWTERLFLWPALSGAAILLERITQREPVPPPAPYFEEEENAHAMLRPEQEAVSHNPPDPPDPAAC